VDTPATIPALLVRAAGQFGDQEALVDGSARWTFAELEDAILRCAGAMITAGIERGDRVAVWAPNGRLFVTAALGAVTAGAVLVPLNTRFKGDEARWILAKSRARLLVTDDGFLGNDYAAMARAAGLPSLDEIITPDGRGCLSWAEFLRRASGLPRSAVLDRARSVSPHDMSDMFFTSGTTGRPKGVMTAHGQNVRVYEAWADGVGLRGGDRYLVVNPMFHTFGYKAGLLACLIRGATVVSVPLFDPAAAIRLIASERVTVLPGPPTLYASLLDHPARSGQDLSSLRLAVTGASVVPVALVERLRAELFREVIIAYGLTESCGTVTIGDPHADPQTACRTVGKAIAGTEVIVGAPGGGPLPPGESGEVLVRGYNVMRGYFEDPAATAEAIDPAGWLHTGDIGTLDADGQLRITDRLKDMFVVGGFNAYPAEIEQAIAKHEKVSEAAVIGVPDSRLGEVGRAFIVPRPGATVTEAEIIEFCRERLANFKVPRSVRVVAALPRNASGKVLKFELRDLALRERTASPRTTAAAGLPGTGGEAVEEDGGDVFSQLAGGIVTALVVPANGEPYRVADQPVEHPRGDVGPEAAVGDALLDHQQPRALDVGRACQHPGEPLPLAQVVQFVLVDGGGLRLFACHLKGGQHEVVQALRWAFPAGQHAGVAVLDGTQVAGQDLRDDGVLGLEVVVQAPGEYPDRVRDLADGGRADAPAGEQFRRAGENDAATVLGLTHASEPIKRLIGGLTGPPMPGVHY
jgi:acyl-CoA synthetase (AMP-forming)/AMP-acid ligase II